MPAAVIGGIVAGGASIVGGLMANSGAKANAQAITNASDKSVAENKRQFDITRQDLAPFSNTGAAAEGRLAYLLGLNPGSSTQGSWNANYGPMGSAPTGRLPGTTATATGTPARPGTYYGRPAGNAMTAGPGSDFSSVQPYGAAGPGSPSSGMPQQTGALYRNGLNQSDYIMPINSENAGNPHIGTAEDIRNAMYGNATTGGYPLAGADQSQQPADGQFGSLMRDFGPNDFQTDPGYLFRRQEGQKALDRSASAQGGLFSGAALKANDRYNQDFASNEYSNAYNRFQSNRQTKYNFLSGLAGGGQGTAQTVGQLGAQYAGINSGTLMNAANNAANLRASGYNALAGSIAALPGTYQAGYTAFGRG